MMTVLIGASEPAEPSLHLASELQEEKSASIPLHHVSVFSPGDARPLQRDHRSLEQGIMGVRSHLSNQLSAIDLSVRGTGASWVVM